MTLSADAEQAFTEAVEAAYAMTDALERYGEDSAELDHAIALYGERLREYYRLTQQSSNAFWADQCEANPAAEECRLYDC